MAQNNKFNATMNQMTNSNARVNDSNQIKRN